MCPPGTQRSLILTCVVLYDISKPKKKKKKHEITVVEESQKSIGNYAYPGGSKANKPTLSRKHTSRSPNSYMLNQK